jgi:hypothetical protein
MDPTTTPKTEDNLKPSTALLVATTGLVVLNIALGFLRGLKQNGNISFAIGSGISAILWPVIITLLFSIGKAFRNPRSRTKVVFWTSLVVLFGTLVNLTGLVAPRS